MRIKLLTPFLTCDAAGRPKSDNFRRRQLAPLHHFKEILRIITLVLIYPWQLHLAAQEELVANGNFEAYEACPTYFGGIDSSIIVYPTVEGWSIPSFGSSDYFNECASGVIDVPLNIFGYQEALSGAGYCGLYLKTDITNYREYIQVQLTEPLIAGTCYLVSMYVGQAAQGSSGAYVNYTTDQLGMYISNDRPTLFEPFEYLLDVVPQVTLTPETYPDTAGWTLVSSSYIATGGEEWLTIGNFTDDDGTVLYPIVEGESYPDSKYAYVYIDDVSVKTSDIIDPFSDTTICEGDTLLAEIPDGLFDYTWSTGSMDSSIMITNSGLYSYTASGSCGFYSDTLEVEFISSSFIETDTTIIVCSFDFPYTLQADTSFNDWYWDNNSNDTTVFIYEPGTYFITYLNECGLKTDSFYIYEQDVPDIQIVSPTGSLCADEYGLLLQAISTTENLIWSTGDNTASLEVFTPGAYSVTASDICGIAMDSILIENCDDIKLPTAFSPNGDGVNDWFMAYGDVSVEQLSIYIYNQWGEEVYAASEVDFQWDGTYRGQQQPIGAYVYTLSYSIQGKDFLKSGTVTLIR